MLVQSSEVTSVSLLLTLRLVCKFGEASSYYRSHAFALSVLPVDVYTLKQVLWHVLAFLMLVID